MQANKKTGKTYTLRDTIHMDIKFEEKFFEIISTEEFQRLARIRQLSSEYLLFPTATHTRFSHSIGTYYVMKKLVGRLEEALSRHHISVTEEQKDLALCSALVHDIGHGPFSHTFEAILGGESHESWTIRILEDKSTQINQVITKNFGQDFLCKLIKIFQGHQEDHKDTMLELIQQLISSQMDADRMDYLLRDSYFTGVNTGVYDLDRVIESIEIEEMDQELRICVSEKYLSSIEEYVMARFYMHREVYQHPLKRQLENIILKIFKRSRELYAEGKLEHKDFLMEKVLQNQISLDDYLRLDDNILMYHIAMWRYSEDDILSTLSKAFVDRKKFERYRNKTGQRLDELLNMELEKRNIEPIDWQEEYSYIRDQVKIPLYDKNHNNIWVKEKSGSVADLSDVSYILKNIDFKNKFERTNEYYHRGMIQRKFGPLLE